MQKPILDTNVIVSSLIQKNYPYQIVKYCIEGNAVICIYSAILDEYFEVLNRPKFAKFPDFKKNADLLLTSLSENALISEPKIKINLINDEPDNRFLELTQAANADFIITGNSTDFTMKNFKDTKIVSPKEFWESL